MNCHFPSKITFKSLPFFPGRVSTLFLPYVFLIPTSFKFLFKKYILYSIFCSFPSFKEGAPSTFLEACLPCRNFTSTRGMKNAEKEEREKMGAFDTCLELFHLPIWPKNSSCVYRWHHYRL